jgi:hypothetical protein
MAGRMFETDMDYPNIGEKSAGERKSSQRTHTASQDFAGSSAWYLDSAQFFSA